MKTIRLILLLPALLLVVIGDAAALQYAASDISVNTAGDISLPTTSHNAVSATGDKLSIVIPSAATAQPWRSRGTREIASRENRKSWLNRALRHPWPRCHGAIWFDFAPLRCVAPFGYVVRLHCAALRCAHHCAQAMLTMTVSPSKQCCPPPKVISVAEDEARIRLSRDIAELLNHDDFQNSLWGISIRDAESGAVLYARDAIKSFMPASNVKLYTTATALHYLGPGFRYRTGLYTDGQVKDGVLHGNLIVRGSGDPVIGGRFNDNDRTELFRQWADTLRSAGIHQIRGDIIGDGTIFDSPPLGSSWSWDYLTYWYAAEHAGLSFNDNTVDAAIIGTTAGRPAQILIEPNNTSYVQILNHTLTVPADSARRISYDRPIGSNRITIANHVPEGDTIRYSLSIPNPTLYFAHVLHETLLLEGIPVQGRPADIAESSVRPDYDRLTLITTHESPPLADIVDVVNTVSQNMYAETLLMTVGALFPPDNSENRNSHQKGLIRQNDFLGGAGVDTSRIALVDGSGLSRRNLVTPHMTTSLLRYMWMLPDGEPREAYMKSLPVGGNPEGTLRTLFRSGPASMNVRAKTGTIGGARALSGYVDAANGRTYAFSMMSNNHLVSTGRVNQVIEAVVQMLAAYPHNLNANHTE